MSIFMVFGWLVGDMFKVCYFILLAQPMQFIVCGTVQVSVDILIVIQVFYYGGAEKKSLEDPEELTAVNRKVL